MGSYDEIGSSVDPHEHLKFTATAIASQVVGLIMVILSGCWMGSYHGGYGWDISTVFNYHPLFMTMGMIFLYGDGKVSFKTASKETKAINKNNLDFISAILVYRLFRNTTKMAVKILHGLIHIAVLVFGSIALKAVFDSHNKAAVPIPNLYSLHSWVGLSAVVLFGLQWVMGFASFLFPTLSDALRKRYLPHHKFWGLTVFVMCCAAALMGITEKAFFALKGNPSYSQSPPEATLLNFFGMSIVIYCGLIVYLVTKHEYKRPPENQ